jgi:signal transduction histidine kinase
MERVDDLTALLMTIIDESKRMLRSDAASIALYDSEHNNLVFTVASGGAGEGLKQWRIDMGQGIVGLVAQSREALYSNDPKNDPRWFGKVDTSSGFVTRNLAAVPMIRSGNLVGVLEALNRPDGDYDDEDLRLLQIFADQAALALEINRLIEAKQESERLATFGVALADIGHSVKNLLMRLEFPIKLIDKAMTNHDAAQATEPWGVMKRATHEISGLVKDMLNYSKKRDPELAETDVAQMLRQVCDGVRMDAESKEIQLACEGADAEIMWVLDPNTLRQALNNLVGNAIEAIASHGGSKVTTRLAVTDQPAELRISIADDGPGIPPEIQRRIFDPFFSTKGSKGTGLGLANVKKGVEEHGGRVTLTSEPGKGATFTLIFPKKSL